MGRRPEGRLAVTRAVLDLESELKGTRHQGRFIGIDEILAHPLIAKREGAVSTKQNIVKGAARCDWLEKHPSASAKGLYRITDAGRKALQNYEERKKAAEEAGK